jgi:hypothetical protein
MTSACLLAPCRWHMRWQNADINHLQASGESGWRKLGHIRQEFGGILGFVRQLIGSLPTRVATPTAQMRSVDHLMAIIGM